MDQALAAERARAIERDDLLSSLPSGALGACARLAGHVTALESAGIHLLDDRMLRRIAAHNAPLGSWPLADEPCLRVVETGAPMHAVDVTADAQFRDSSIRGYAGTAIRDHEGVVVGTVCAFDTAARPVSPAALSALDEIGRLLSEVVALRRSNAELAHSAMHDSLTGLPNRRLMIDHLVRAMSRRSRQPGEPVVAVLDLDGFKQVNDRYGHATGDQVLIEVASRLREATRSADIVARLAGDEFVIIVDALPTGLDMAAFTDELTERVRGCFAAPLRLGEMALTIGASIGTACAQEGELSYELLGRADAAMFDDKRARNPAR